MVIGLIVLVLFGRGRVADIMGEFGKGLKSFKHGMKDDEDEQARRLEGPVNEGRSTPGTAQGTAGDTARDTQSDAQPVARPDRPL